MDDFPILDLRETLHGVTVSDPYRWLEDRGSSLTTRWLEAQHKKAAEYLAGCSNVDGLRQRVRALLDREEIMQPVKIGTRILFRRRSIGQEQSCICVSNLERGTTNVLVDPSEYGSLTSALIHCVNEDGSLLAFAVASSGADAKEIHFMDTDRGNIFSDHLPVGKSRGIKFFADKSGYYYSHDKLEIGTPESHSIRSHSFGDARESDTAIFSLPRSGLSKLILLGDDAHLGGLYIYESAGSFRSDLYRTPRNDHSKWTLLAAGISGSTNVVLRKNRIFLLRETENQLRCLESFEPGKGGIQTVVPTDSQTLLETSIRQNYIYSHHFDGAESTIRVWSLDGSYLGEVDAPRGGTVRMCSPSGSCSDALFYTYESFNSPPAIFHFDPETFSSRCWFAGSSAVPTRHYLPLKTSFPGKDGTSIPVTLITDDRQPTLDGRHAIMTSYGGFGVSMTPQFSVVLALMIELGLIFVIPHIRGGGEGGASWHRAAVGLSRQVAFDDFISAAEWLCREGITTPDRLAIFGGSNSGLLVAAVTTQRPELFRVVLCIGGLLDMVRYERFDRAAKWRDEFGSIQSETEFHALHAYSPYHRVDDSIDYPSMLFVSGDKDDRCNPAHSRKMVARLQLRSAQQNPILLDYATYRGHSPVLPLSIRIEALTFRLAFLCKELCIDIPRRLKYVAPSS
jgi:prolyl oligopeptidase